MYHILWGKKLARMDSLAAVLEHGRLNLTRARVELSENNTQSQTEKCFLQSKSATPYSLIRCKLWVGMAAV